ncbi:MAG: endonuclease III [Tunicatimonas sp.]
MASPIPFDIHEAVRRLRPVVTALPKAALFDLYDQGYTSLFEQLIACIISIRTYDEVTVPTSLRLFDIARTPEALRQLTPIQIDAAIFDSTYHEAKSYQIHAIATTVTDTYGGELPGDFDVLTSFKGVGPKCASLTLGIALGQPYIGVDIHVHRVTNRWGYVTAKTPEKTMEALQQRLPKEYWVEINRLLVPYGKHVCRGTTPRCSECVLLDMCEQRGVMSRR